MLDGFTSLQIDQVLPAQGKRPRAETDTFNLGLIKHRPNLKAFACSLARNTDVADDLVQETMMRALTYRDRFQTGTNQRAWLFTILKNLFRTKLRKDAYQTELTDVIANSAYCSTAQTQEDALYLKEVTAYMKKLPDAQKNAVVLVGALGYSIEEMAAREKCQAGTVKSRVSRGRSALLENVS